VSWYGDGSDTATGSAAQALTTSWAEYHVPISGIVREVAFEFTNTDDGGWIEVIPISIELYDLISVRR
jgi:hypothetical protein